jgi:hypothetical protein
MPSPFTGLAQPLERVQKHRRIFTALPVKSQLRGGSRVFEPHKMGHLAAVAAMPNVTLQILPSVAHPANASELIVTDSAAYAEHVVGGYVFTEEETVTRLARLFHTILCESYRASESAAMIQEVGQIWTGASPAPQTPTADRA